MLEKHCDHVWRVGSRLQYKNSEEDEHAPFAYCLKCDDAMSGLQIMEVLNSVQKIVQMFKHENFKSENIVWPQ
jgi:hypothetical protein